MMLQVPHHSGLLLWFLFSIVQMHIETPPNVSLRCLDKCWLVVWSIDSIFQGQIGNGDDHLNYYHLRTLAKTKPTFSRST